LAGSWLGQGVFFGDGRRFGKVLGMDGSGFGAVVRGGAGWEDVADEAVSVRTSYSLSFISFSFPDLQRIVFCFLSFCISFFQEKKGAGRFRFLVRWE
jgi:hypothetical protein